MIERCKDRQTYEAASKNKISLNQTWLWGETRDRSEAVRFIVNGRPATIYVRSNNSGFMKFGYAPRLLDQDGYENKELVTALVEQGKELGLSHLIIEPNARHSQDKLDFMLQNGFIESGKTIQPNQTQLVDLSASEEELMKDMKSKTRQYVRKTAKNGIEVQVDNSQAGFDQFYEVMESIVARKQYVMHDKKYFQRIYDTYQDSGSVNILIAKKDSQLLGAYFTISEGDTMYELYGGVKPEGEKLRVGYALKWNSIVKSKQLGLKNYDMWGVAPLLEDGSFDSNDSMFQISRFKSSFGGEVVTFLPQLTYVYSKPKYAVFNFMLKLHKIIIGLKKR